MKFEFLVPGPPRGKGRPRFTKTGMAYTDDKTAAYENLVRLAFQAESQGAPPLTGPVSLSIIAYMPIPSSLSDKRKRAMVGKPHTKKSDADNIAKAVNDGLNGVAYADDSQIWMLIVRKVYSETPRLEVTIEETEGADHAANP